MKVFYLFKKYLFLIKVKGSIKKQKNQLFDVSCYLRHFPLPSRCSEWPTERVRMSLATEPFKNPSAGWWGHQKELIYFVLC